MSFAVFLPEAKAVLGLQVTVPLLTHKAPLDVSTRVETYSVFIVQMQFDHHIVIKDMITSIPEAAIILTY